MGARVCPEGGEARAGEPADKPRVHSDSRDRPVRRACAEVPLPAGGDAALAEAACRRGQDCDRPGDLRNRESEGGGGVSGKEAREPVCGPGGHSKPQLGQPCVDIRRLRTQGRHVQILRFAKAGVGLGRALGGPCCAAARRRCAAARLLPQPDRCRPDGRGVGQDLAGG